MTLSFWDTQMQFSAILPDFAACLADLAARSAEFATDRAFDRIPYGPDPRQWVERTAGTGPDSVLPVIIHGGYWRALDAENHRIMMAGFADVGAHVANVEYRLMPHARLQDLIDDVVAGLATLCQSAPGAQLLLVGHSAGAHLALAALRAPCVGANVRGVIAISGVYDLWPVTQCFVQSELHLSAAEVAAHSLDPYTPRAPVVYLTGALETYEFQRQSARMASGARTRWAQIPNAHHMTVPIAATTRSAVQSALHDLKQLETQP